MNELVEIWERSLSAKYLIAGWHQWADAGSISSGLPLYLVEQTQATRIGRIRPDGFYLFQIPGAHHLLRPVVQLEQGHRKELQQRRNEFFCCGDGRQDFLVFLGEEPHYNEDQYADAFFDAVQDLGIERVATVAGVYGPVPYNKDRDISCVYSLPRMKDDLAQYTVRFSNYTGGATISTYLAHRAEARGIEFFTFYAFVPSYNFPSHSIVTKTVAIEEDYKAWYDLMIRLNHMFDLNVDLFDLKRQSEELAAAWDLEMDELARKLPHLEVRDYLDEVNAGFTERQFSPLSDVWEEALRDIFDKDEEL